jgi:hypothetical protein
MLNTAEKFQRSYTKMRKIMMIVTLAVSMLAVSAATLNASLPAPTCDPNCPWVR